MTDPERTDPNWRTRLSDANAKADPWFDRALKAITDSPYTAVIVVLVVVLLVGLTKWLLG